MCKTMLPFYYLFFKKKWVPEKFFKALCPNPIFPVCPVVFIA